MVRRHAQNTAFATEWSGGHVINLGPGEALSINNASQAVGYSGVNATEWSGGSVINLRGLPGYTESVANGVNDAGQAVGVSIVDGRVYATSPKGV